MTEVQDLKDHVERKITDQLSEGLPKRVVYHVGSKDLMYGRTMAHYKQLLQQAGDLATALEAVDVLFTVREFSWKTRTAVSSLLSDWHAALAIVQARQTAEEEAAERHQVFDDIAGQNWESLVNG